MIVENRIDRVVNVWANGHRSHHTQTGRCGQTVGGVVETLFGQFENAHVLGIGAADDVFIDADLSGHKVQLHLEWHFHEVDVLEVSVFVHTLIEFVEFDETVLRTNDRTRSLAHGQFVRVRELLVLRTGSHWKGKEEKEFFFQNEKFKQIK